MCSCHSTGAKYLVPLAPLGCHSDVASASVCAIFSSPARNVDFVNMKRDSIKIEDSLQTRPPTRCLQVEERRMESGSKVIGWDGVSEEDVASTEVSGVTSGE